MRRVVQIAMVGIMAAPVLYQAVWPAVFRLWPACQAPDGSILLCIIYDEYTRPRDLTALGISTGLGLIGATVLYFATSRVRRGRFRFHT